MLRIGADDSDLFLAKQNPYKPLVVIPSDTDMGNKRPDHKGEAKYFKINTQMDEQKFTIEQMKQAFDAGSKQIWEDLEQTTQCSKYESFKEWFEAEFLNN